MPKKEFDLIELILNEVSLVDEGANPGAKIALIKRKEKSESTAKDKTLKIGDITMTPEEMQAMQEKLAELEEGNLALTAKMEELTTENAKLKQDASEAAPSETEEEIAARKAEEEAGMTDEEIAARKIEDDEVAAAAAKADDDESPSAVAARKRMTSLEKSNKKLQDTVSKMVEREEITKYTDMGNAYSNFPVTPEEIGKVLRVVNKNQKAGEILEKILTSGHEALLKSFTAIGDANLTAPESDWATTRDAFAKEHNVTTAKATQECKKLHPKKWADMRKSQAQH